MKTIHKYALSLDEIQTVSLPVGHEVLSAQLQNGALCLWVLVDKEETQTVKQLIYVIGTGHDVLAPPLGFTRKFIDSVQVGKMVKHVFAAVVR